jgi:replicative DNA helicase
VARDAKVLPHNLDAEASLLGAVLLRSEALAQVDRLEPEDFYDPRHQAILIAMRSLEAQLRPIDPVTLQAELERAGRLEAVGGISYIATLGTKVPSADNIEHYYGIIRDLRAARRVMTAAGEINAKGYEDYGDIDQYLDESEAKIFEATQREGTKNTAHVKVVLKDVFRSLDARFKAAGGVTGVPSGFTALDERTAGFQPTELIVVGARPAMGKTAFAMSIARNAACQFGYPVLVFTLEMSSGQLAERLLCSEAKVDSTALRRGTLQRQDLTNLTYAATALEKAPIVLDDTPALTLRTLRSTARRFMADRDLVGDKTTGLIIVDYLQLMNPPSRGRGESNRAQEVSEISRGLKSLARELKVPIMALSQVSRGVESREDKRPGLADLRESGAIEQDADLILFLYRDVVYRKDECEEPNIAEVIIGKNRHGPVDTVKTFFEGKYTRFDNLSSRDER